MLRLLPLSLVLICTVCAAEPAIVSLSAAGKSLASAPLPEGWSAVPAGEKTVIIPAQKRPHIQVWSVAAADVATAEAGIGALIVSEVTEFAPATRTDLTVAGHPARQLSGTGVEADDGDPGSAEVTIFAIGNQVFVLVSHGEGSGVADRHAEVLGLLGKLVAR